MSAVLGGLRRHPVQLQAWRGGLRRGLQLWLIYCFLVGFLLGAGLA
jgi:hypothetical protein